MADLSEEHKLYVLERRAEFAPKWRIVEELKELFEVSVSPQALTIYDPTTNTGKDKLSPEHKAHFNTHRKAFLADRSRIGLSHSNFRLQVLQDLLDHPVYGQNPELRRVIVEMAEKIEGGMYQVRVSPAEAEGIISDIGIAVRKAVDTHVTDADQRNRVHAETKKIMAEARIREPD